MAKTIEKTDTFGKLLEKDKLYKFLRITAWICKGMEKEFIWEEDQLKAHNQIHC